MFSLSFNVPFKNLLSPTGSIKSEIIQIFLCLFKIFAIKVEPDLPDATIKIGF